MKKGKFNGLSFDNLEKLSRDEQKKVVGGYSNDSSGGGACPRKVCAYQVTRMLSDSTMAFTTQYAACTTTSSNVNGRTICIDVCPRSGAGSCF